MTKILVTGATGFIGRHVVKQLRDAGGDIDILTVSRTDSTDADIQLDLQDTEAVRRLMQRIKPKKLLHLAWNVDEGYWESLENLNWLTASLELLKVFADNGGERAVFAGSCVEYDWKYGYLSESLTPLEPTSLYGISKVSLYKMTSAYAKQVGLSFAWGRVFFLYGEGEKKGRLVPSIIDSLLKGQPPVLKQPHLVRDYMHVKDVASAFVELLSSELEGAVNIASGCPVEIQEIARHICKIVGLENIRLMDQMKMRDEIPILIGDTRRLTHELNFIPKIALIEGLSAAVHWWKEEMK